MTLTAFVLVCAIGAPTCSVATAVEVYKVPPKEDAPMELPFACMLYAQEWAALHVTLEKGQWLKTYCVPPDRLPGNVG